MNKFDKLFRCVTVLVVFIGFIGALTWQGGADSGKIHPALFRLAEKAPEQEVEVIVQKLDHSRTAEALVRQLGGQIVNDLRIINAFAAVLKAGATLRLSDSPAVRWVSLNSAVFSSSLVDVYVADYFEVRSYGNQDGILPWAGSWTELNDDGKPDAGKVKVDQLRLRMEDGNRGIQRTLDLSQATAPVLSFNYRRDSMSKAGAFVLLEVSKDGGATWTLLDTISGPASDADLLPAVSYDLAPYASAATTLRFRTSSSMTGRLWVDNLKVSFTQSEPLPMFTTWATGIGASAPMEFTNPAAIVDENGLGPDGLFGYGTNVKGSFTGFEPSVVEGYKIGRVEAVLYAYIDKPSNESTKFKVYVGGSKTGEVQLTRAFDGVVGPQKVGPVYVNLTNLNNWDYADFYNSLELFIEQAQKSDEVVRYDAVGLRVTLVPGLDPSENALEAEAALPKAAVDVSRLQNVAPLSVRADRVWNAAPNYLQGDGVTVAVVDSGVLKNKDLGGRKLKDINFNREYHDAKDRYGHGTLVANLVAGDGTKSGGAYMGIAPQSDIVNVRISNDQGMSTEADVVEALGWILEFKDRYNIRVINLSLNSSVAQSYHTSPLCAAVEVLWFNGIVVVVSAGNSGGGVIYPPANDPFVITVGAADDRMTVGLADDQVATFSVYGLTESGYAKPDLVAPGKNLVAYLPKTKDSNLGRSHPERLVGADYLRVSGTSFAAPIVSGAAALLLQDEPTLTPDQVKFRLKSTAVRDPQVWPGYDPVKAGAGYLDVYAAVNANTIESANVGQVASQLLWTGSSPINWSSVAWNSVAWNSVAWNSVAWNSVAWNSVAWNSDYWGP